MDALAYWITLVLFMATAGGALLGAAVLLLVAHDWLLRRED